MKFSFIHIFNIKNIFIIILLKQTILKKLILFSLTLKTSSFISSVDWILLFLSSFLSLSLFFLFLIILFLSINNKLLSSSFSNNEHFILLWFKFIFILSVL